MKYALLFAFAFLSCSAAWSQNSETRKVGGFREVSIGLSHDVYLREGDSEEVRLEGPSEVLERIITEVRGNRLVITKKKGNWKWGWKDLKKVKIYVTYRKLKALSNSGSSDVVVESLIQRSSFSLSCSGSGDIKLELEVNSLNIGISGSSDIKIAGRADKQEMSISGSGDIDALNLKGEEVSIQIAGSGDVRVYATEKLEGQVTGSGDISYRGNPKTKVRIVGSGDLRRVN